MWPTMFNLRPLAYYGIMKLIVSHVWSMSQDTKPIWKDVLFQQNTASKFKGCAF